ncbi:MAG: hypothetical protein NC253_09120 [Ruminococcus sp.]|nr:hypothetical protein [Ruminococcus sp.]MCM1380518.1 hypothetical protein [Muribaculaceae bacterium]
MCKIFPNKPAQLFRAGLFLFTVSVNNLHILGYFTICTQNNLKFLTAFFSFLLIFYQKRVNFAQKRLKISVGGFGVNWRKKTENFLRKIAKNPRNFSKMIINYVKC